MPITPDVAATSFQPRLRWYSHAWRAAVALAISLVGWGEIVGAQRREAPGLLALDVVLGAVAFVLLHLRRRHPLPVALAITAFGPFSALASGPAILALVSLATGRRWWQILSVALANVAATLLYYRVQPIEQEPWWLTTTFTVVAVTAMVAIGLYIGSRRELVGTLRQRAESAEAERDLREARARSMERARIAREMHDVLAHRITQISLQAGALSYREDLDAAALREGVGAIRGTAHEALQDLREVLGVLRADVPDRAERPQPTYADLPGLVEAAQRSGTDLRIDDRLGHRPDAQATPPDAVGRTIYRIVQECLTNAAKHAPAAPLQVSLSGSPDEGVHLVLRNALGFGPSPTPGSRLGLVGLSERAELRGGWLHHGVELEDDGVRRFVVRAWLPWSGADGAAPAAPERLEAGR